MGEQNDFVKSGGESAATVPDIPLGFGMALFMEADARKNFNNLSDSQKTSVINYIRTNNITGEDARRKVDTAVQGLKKNSIDFI